MNPPYAPVKAWEVREQSDTDIGCFGKREQAPQSFNSLFEIYHAKETLARLDNGQLLSIWKTFCSLSTQKLSIFEKIILWKDDTSRDKISQQILKRLLPELIKRGLSLEHTQSETLKLWLTESSFLKELFESICEPEEHIAQNYLAAEKFYQPYLENDTFESQFLHALCTSKSAIIYIDALFTQLKAFKSIPDLLKLIDLCPKNLSIPILAWISITRDRILKPPEPKPQPKPQQKPRPYNYYKLPEPLPPPSEKQDSLSEYQKMLQAAGVPKDDWATMHGFRLASLYYHPDRNSGHEEEFKRLALFAEKLEIKK